METLGLIVDYLGIVIGLLMGIIFAIAMIRSIIKARRGQRVDIPDIGVRRDLPDSVTGRNRFWKDD